MIKIWLQAARLRTLPLALSSIAMGNFLALAQGSFRVEVMLLAVLTTVFLQVLSNFANDYGDTVHGADNHTRSGPARTVQMGVISLQSMRLAILLTTVLALISGIALVWMALGHDLYKAIGFVGLGFLSIGAAIYYTNGKVPYGYLGLGDISVFLFFGLLGVIGSYYLQVGSVTAFVLLPAVCNGALAVGVLNINNIRDIDSDRRAGKFSIPVRIGRKWAVVYHGFLLSAALICGAVFAFWQAKSTAIWVFLLVLPLWWSNFIAVSQNRNIDSLLKQLAISSLIFTFLFGIGMLIKI